MQEILSQRDRYPQATKVTRSLLRYIRERGLHEGDKLPSQEELRQNFGFHNTTLDTAMELLVSAGVLTRKRKVGTVVLNPNAYVRGLWHVGLALLPSTTSQPFYGQLLHHLHTHLHETKATLHHYMLDRSVKGREIEISKFEGFVEDLEAERLDVVLSLSSFPEDQWRHQSALGNPFVHVGSWENAPCGVVIEQSRMVREALALLVRKGCRRVAIVGIGGGTPGYDRFRTGFEQATSEFDLPYGDHLNLHQGEGPSGGMQVAKALLSMSSSLRPDGLIAIDDRVASGLTATLATQRSYCPIIAVQTNRQAPLAFGMPIVEFEVDVNEMAFRAVQMVKERMFKPFTPDTLDWIYPQMKGENSVKAR